jgi:mannose-6-phosphate isomerase-like protein (cupin superfamily)
MAALGAERAVVVQPGEGHRVGNVEFLARSADTPRFNFAIVTKGPGEGPPVHHHDGEDDAFYVLEGEVTFIVDGDEVVARPGTFVLVPPGVPHTFANRSEDVVRFANVHAPAGFDVRLESD